MEIIISRINIILLKLKTFPLVFIVIVSFQNLRVSINALK